MHARRGFLLAVVLMILLVASAARAATDRFTCYLTRTTSGTPKFAPRGVQLTDAVRSSGATVKRERFLCAPASLNGGQPEAPTHPDHLEGYQIKATPRFQKLGGVRVVDDFGMLILDLVKPTTLQVPTAKSHTAPPAAPSAPAVDHFQCYQARPSKGTTPFARRTVTVGDQFGTHTLELKKVRRVCFPVDKNAESPGAENHTDHLICYQARDRSAPRFSGVSPLYTANQFGNETVQVKKPVELCLPALRIPVGPTPTAPQPTATPTPSSCGNGALDAATEECDGLTAPTCPGMCQPNCACPGVCDGLDPSVCLFPFPNDFFTVADSATVTGRRVNLALTATPRNVAGVPIDPSDVNRADGFSPGQAISLRVPGFDPGVTGAVPITDVERSFDPAQPIVVINASTLQRHLIWSEIDSHADTEASRALYIRPAVNFDEGTRYVVALRNMKDSTGAPIAPSTDFLAYRDGVPTGDAAKEARRAHMEAVFATLAAAGVARNDVYLAWDFTVASRASLTKRALGMRDDAFGANGLGDADLADVQVAGAAPTFAIVSSTNLPPCGNDGCAGGAPPENPPGGQEFCEGLKTVSELAPLLVGVNCNLLPGSTPSESDSIARRIEGTVTVPCYLFPNCQPGGTFTLDANGIPTRNPASYSANFVCNIPRAAFDNGDAATGTAVPARPSLYGHGLLGTASEVNGGNVQAMGNEHDMIFCATDWAGFATSDVGSVVATLQDASNFPKMVDRMQQGFLNFMYLGRALLHANGFAANAAFQDSAGQSLIDPTRLFYDGNSQGGIMGGSLTALAPDFTRAVLGVPGMNYSTLLQRSSDFAPYAEGKLLGAADPSLEDVDTPFGLYDNYPNQLEQPLVFALLQMLWDRGEANGYAHHMTTDPLPNTPAHTVLLHEAFGDHQVANITTEVEARTIGATIYQPALAPGRHADVDPYFGIPPIVSFPFAGSALVVWDSGTPTPPTTNTPNEGGSDPHGRPRNTASARLQKSEFLQDGGAVVDVCAGAPCLAP
ncbi:MAG: hypothetical protein ABIR79_25570 [Candidatus Binatia bacterium]